MDTGWGALQSRSFSDEAQAVSTGATETVTMPSLANIFKELCK